MISSVQVAFFAIFSRQYLLLSSIDRIYAIFNLQHLCYLTIFITVFNRQHLLVYLQQIAFIAIFSRQHCYLFNRHHLCYRQQTIFIGVFSRQHLLLPYVDSIYCYLQQIAFMLPSVDNICAIFNRQHLLQFSVGTNCCYLQQIALIAIFSRQHSLLSSVDSIYAIFN